MRFYPVASTKFQDHPSSKVDVYFSTIHGAWCIDHGWLMIGFILRWRNGGSLGMVQFTLESPGFEVSQAALFWCPWSPGAVCQANEAIAGGHSGIALAVFFSNTISRLPGNHGESIHFGVSHGEYWYWMILIYIYIYWYVYIYIYIMYWIWGGWDYCSITMCIIW